MNRTKAVAWVAGAGLATLLAGCGGGGSGSATIGGSVSGLAPNESLVLTNNGGDNITVSSNTSFKFAHSVGSQGAYNVQVLTQPANQTCSVSQGSGIINYSGDNISDVAVLCTNNAAVGATVSGLESSGQLVLALTTGTNADTLLQTTVTNTSATNVNYFTSAAGTTVTLPLGTVYTVSVYSNPTNPKQACTADASSKPTGGVTNSNPITVNFICH